MNLWGAKKRGRMISFPKPDRSEFSPKLTGEAEWLDFDIAWGEGELKDGRPYRAELWSWRDLWVVTFFFSTIGMEDAGEPGLARFLEEESLVKFSETRKVYPERLPDSGGNEMWSISIPIREGNKNFIKLGFRLNPYLPSSIRQEPDFAAGDP